MALVHLCLEDDQLWNTDQIDWKRKRKFNQSNNR